MRLLLDTHAFIWFVLNDPQLSRTADALITDPTNDVFVSPATYWEIAIKVGKKKLDNPPAVWGQIEKFDLDAFFAGLEGESVTELKQEFLQS
jgi:PIN domain nuclease of toxin-antitoxin system